MELNAEQIKKALECCSKGICDDCPYRKDDILDISCAINMSKDALTLITSQEQRIRELTEENERLRADKDYWKNRAKESDSEYYQAVKRGYEHGTADSAGVFAERFALRYGTYTDKDMTPIAEVFRLLDQIAKEMAEGDYG